MAVGFEIANGSTFAGDADGNVSFSFDAGTGPSRCLWVWVGSFGTSSATVTYNGVSLTAIDRTYNSNQDGLWFLQGPASGSNTLAINGSSAGDIIVCAVVTNNTLQTGTPYQNLTTGSGSGTTHSLAITSSQSDSLILAFDESGNTISGPNQTSATIQNLNGSSGIGNGAAQYATGNGSSVTCSWASNGDLWFIAGLEVLPAPAMDMVEIEHGYDNTDQASSYTTGTVTVTQPDALLEMAIWTYGTTTAPNPTPVGIGTWVAQTSQVDGVTAMFTFKCQLSGTPSPATITINVDAAALGCARSIVQIKGHDVAAPIVQAVVGGGPGDISAVTNASIGLAAAGGANNRALSFWMHRAQEVTTPATSWTELADDNDTTPSRGHETQWRSDAFDTSPAASWATSSRWQGVAFEIRAAGIAAVPDAPIQFVAIGARSAGGTTTVAPSYPSGVAAEVLAVAGRSEKPETATCLDEPGWMPLADRTGGTGTTGIDVGLTRAHCDVRELLGTESGSVTFDQGNSPNSVNGWIALYSKDPSYEWRYIATSGDDNTHGTGRSATGSAIDFLPGDMLIAICSSDTDTNTAYTSPALTASGITFGTTNQRLGAGGVTTGNDTGGMHYDAIVVSGSGTVAPTLTLSGGPSACGAVLFIRLRQVKPSPEPPLFPPYWPGGIIAPQYLESPAPAGGGGNDVNVTGHLALAAPPFSTTTHDATVVGHEPQAVSARSTVTGDRTPVVGHEPVAVFARSAVSHDTSIAGNMPVGVLPFGTFSHDVSVAGHTPVAVTPYGVVTTVNDVNVVGIAFPGVLPFATISHDAVVAGHVPVGVLPYATVSHDAIVVGHEPVGVTPYATISHDISIAEVVPVAIVAYAPISHDIPLTEVVPVGVVPYGPIIHNVNSATAVYPGVVPFSTVTHDATVTGQVPVAVTPYATISHDALVSSIVPIAVATYSSDPSTDKNVPGILFLGIIPFAPVSRDSSVVGHMAGAVLPYSTVSHDTSVAGKMFGGVLPYSQISHDIPVSEVVPVGLGARATVSHEAVVVGMVPSGLFVASTVSTSRTVQGFVPLGIEPHAPVSSLRNVVGLTVVAITLMHEEPPSHLPVIRTGTGLVVRSWTVGIIQDQTTGPGNVGTRGTNRSATR